MTGEGKSIGKDHQARLEKHKGWVEGWFEYFKPNIDRFWEFTNFVCNTSLSRNDIAVLDALKKPVMEFNILEAMVSNMRSEFAMHEPSINVRIADGISTSRITQELLDTAEAVEGHLRLIFDSSANDDLQSVLNSDQFIGGWSAAIVSTRYVHSMSFEQEITVERVYDPTLTIFDPMARESHKGDGAYCGMLIPYTKDRFIKEFGESAAIGMTFGPISKMKGFQWTYSNQQQDVVLVAYMFVKKSKKCRIVRLSNGMIMEVSKYREMLEQWSSIAQPPIPLEERDTEIECIDHYRFCDTKELFHCETDYKYLPIVFVDGNSVLIREDGNSGGATQQMCRPYVYHAKDAQRSKNLAGQSIMNEIENMVMHKFVASVEAVPGQYQEAYENVQHASVLLYNAFDSQSGERLDPPREIQRTPTPPILESAFAQSDAVIQATLGSYDAAQGLVGDMSGKAIMQGALQSSSAAGPYLINYLKAWNRIGNIVLDLIPKYYKTPRSLPIVDKDGKRSFVLINDPNDPNSLQLNYDSSLLQLRVEAGANSRVQKQMSLEYMIKLMSVAPNFARLMDGKAMDVLIDNLDVRGADIIKSRLDSFMKETEQAAQNAPNEAEIQMEAFKEVEMTKAEAEFAKVEQRREESEGKLAIAAAELALDREKLEIEYLEMLSKIEASEQKVLIEKERAASEDAKSAIELIMKMNKDNVYA